MDIRLTMWPASMESKSVNDEGEAAHETTFLSEFMRQALQQSDDLGLRYQEYHCTLFARSVRELEIQLYAEAAHQLDEEVIPLLRQLLTEIDEKQFQVHRNDADLAIILLRGDRLGLHYWSIGMNNEFTMLFDRSQEVWTAIGPGKFFDW